MLCGTIPDSKYNSSILVGLRHPGIARHVLLSSESNCRHVLISPLLGPILSHTIKNHTRAVSSTEQHTPAAFKLAVCEQNDTHQRSSVQYVNRRTHTSVHAFIMSTERHTSAFKRAVCQQKDTHQRSSVQCVNRMTHTSIQACIMSTERHTPAFKRALCQQNDTHQHSSVHYVNRTTHTSIQACIMSTERHTPAFKRALCQQNDTHQHSSVHYVNWTAHISVKACCIVNWTAHTSVQACSINASLILIACTVISKWPPRGPYSILHTVNSAVWYIDQRRILYIIDAY